MGKRTIQTDFGIIDYFDYPLMKKEDSMARRSRSHAPASNKQLAQRERFAIKGFISATQSRAKGLGKSLYILEAEQSRLDYIQHECTILLKYFDGRSKEIIDRTKNV